MSARWKHVFPDPDPDDIDRAVDAVTDRAWEVLRGRGRPPRYWSSPHAALHIQGPLEALRKVARTWALGASAPEDVGAALRALEEAAEVGYQAWIGDGSPGRETWSELEAARRKKQRGKEIARAVRAKERRRKKE